MRWHGHMMDNGDTRIVRRFAWFPFLVPGTDEWVWLERYTARQTYLVVFGWTTIEAVLQKREED